MAQHLLSKNDHLIVRSGHLVSIDDATDPADCECCGGEGCEIAADDFDRADDTDIDTGSTAGWTESSGSWAIGSNKLVASSAGIAVCDTPHPDTVPTMGVSVTARHTNNSSTIDLIVGWMSSTNYWYARFTFAGGTGGSVMIRQNDSGSHRTWRTVSNQTLNINTDYTFSVCVRDDGVITASINGVPKASAYSAFPAGDKCGLGCSGSGTATFDDFTMSKVDESCACQKVDHLILSSCTSLVTTGGCFGGSPGANFLPSGGAQEPTGAIVTIADVTQLATHWQHTVPVRDPLCCLRLNGAWEMGPYYSITLPYLPCLREYRFTSGDPFYGTSPNSCNVNQFGQMLFGYHCPISPTQVRWGFYIACLDSSVSYRSDILPQTGDVVMGLGPHTLTKFCETGSANCSWPATVEAEVF